MIETEHPHQKPLVPRFRRGLAILFSGYTILLFISTHVRLPKQSLPGHSDKIAHFVAYVGLSFLLSLWLSSRSKDLSRLLIIVIPFCLLFGMFDELLQIPVGRDCDIWDWVADAVGTCLGVVLFTCFRFCTPANWWSALANREEEQSQP